MSKGLTLEQMAFLVSKGVTAEEMLAFAQMGQGRSKGAERTARWRAKRNGSVTESVTSDVTVTRHSDASQPPNDIYSNPPVSSDEETLAPVRRVKAGLPKPEGVSEQVWSDFLAHRKAKRAPVSKTVIDGIRREAEKAGWTLEAAMAESVAQGWQGFKADWILRDKGFSRTVHTPADVDPLLASIRAKRAAMAPP